MKRNLEGMGSLKIINQDGKGCLAEQILREIFYDVEDFVEKCKQTRESKRGSGCPSLMCSRVNWERRKELDEIKKRLQKLTEYIQFSLNLHNHSSLSNLDRRRRSEHHSSAEHPILLENEDVIGLDDAQKTIKRWVLEEANHVLPLKVIEIYGMPGVGKTTLARKIWKDMKSSKSDHNFDHILFVSLSPNTNLKDVVMGMLENSRHGSSAEVATRGDEVDELLVNLNRLLNGKRYLLFLDGVCQVSKRSWWSKLKPTLFSKEKKGSCIVITTQLKEVARSMGAIASHIYHHKPLSENHSQELFFKIAFPNMEGHRPPIPQVEACAKEMAAKCGGLPLAIKDAALLMLGKEYSSTSWRKTLQHFSEELHEKGESLHSVLRSSYEELSPQLKECYLCLAIFPENYEIFLDVVINLWTSAGLINKCRSKTKIQVGEECFNELIECSLLIGERMNIFETGYYSVKLHGMMRAMMKKIAKEKNYMLLEDDPEKAFPCSPRVCFIHGSDNMDQLIGQSNSKLRILVGREVPENEVFISNVKSKKLRQNPLRVLDVSFSGANSSDSSNKDWMNGVIGSFPLLACLRIENSKLTYLPKSIMRLRNLEILRLYRCSSLKKLPSEIKHLAKLVVLDVSCCPYLKCLPKQIENLSNLEILLGFKPSYSKDGCRLSSLQKMPQLRQLWIQLESEDQIDRGELVVLSQLQKLENLALTLEEKNNAVLIKKLDCEFPSPLVQLNTLYLHKFPGKTSPRWLNPTSLPNLSHLRIYYSNIESFNGVFYGNGDSKFWQLEVLVLTDLYSLEEEWRNIAIATPSLRMFKAYECPRMISLPCPIVDRVCHWQRQEG